MSESPFDNVAALKAVYFMKNTLHQKCFPVNIVKFLRKPILKNSCKQLFLNILFAETREVRNGKYEISQKRCPCLIVLNIFSNCKKMHLVKFVTI